MGIGDWGLGIGDWGLGPIPNPNPQSPIPNPQKLNYLYKLNSKKNFKFNQDYLLKMVHSFEFQTFYHFQYYYPFFWMVFCNNYRERL